MSSRNGFPPIGSVTVALGEVHVLFGFVGRGPCCALAAVTFWASSRFSSLREVAIVLCRRDCSQLIPSQGTAPENREQLCPVTDPDRCRRIWCEFLTGRATPYTATCCWPRPLLTDAAASRTHLELAQTGGISSCHRTARIEQPGRSVTSSISSLLCPVRQPLRGAYNTFDLGGG